MADPVTSNISGPIQIGEGKDKKTIYTALKTTPTTDSEGNKTYKVEIVQYDNANGDGGRVIGEKTDGKINYNNKASDDIKGSPEAQKSINDVSKNQAKRIQSKLAYNNQESEAYHKANGNGNQGTESENDQNVPTLTNVDDAAKTLNAPGGAGQPKPGTRHEKFPGAGGKNPLVFPESLRRDVSNGQDFLKFNMMKYQPKKFDDKSFAFS